MREETEVLSGESYWSVPRKPLQKKSERTAQDYYGRKHEELELDPQTVFDPVPAHRQTQKEPKPTKSWQPPFGGQPIVESRYEPKTKQGQKEAKTTPTSPPKAQDPSV